MPPGAALVVRKEAWQASVPKRLRLIGRVNGAMLSGEDYEALLHMHHGGWEIWYNPDMHSDHQIPAHRLERDYLLSLSRGCGLCICSLQMLRVAPWRAPFVILRMTLGNIKRLVMHRLKHGSINQTDLVTECERAFHVSSLMSPLFFLKSRLPPRFS